MKFSQFTAALVLLCPASSTPVELVPDGVVKRETCSHTTQLITDKVGNGNPHQNFIFKQISGTTDCTNNPSGGAAITNSLTVGWSISGGLAADFLSGGFDVSRSVTTGSTNSFGCKTNKGAHKGSLCVFARIQVTAFTVESARCPVNSCIGIQCPKNMPRGVMYTPNSVQGSCYYDNFQLGLPCKAEGTEHLIKSGPAGGPQFVACQPSHV